MFATEVQCLCNGFLQVELTITHNNMVKLNSKLVVLPERIDLY